MDPEASLMSAVFHYDDTCLHLDINQQLFSSSLLRFWRTGANRHLYASDEDGDIDVRKFLDCQMHIEL